MQQSITMLSLRTQAIAAIIIVVGIILFWIGIFRLTYYFDVSRNTTVLVQAIIYLPIAVTAKILGLIICLRNRDNDWFQIVSFDIATRKKRKMYNLVYKATELQQENGS